MSQIEREGQVRTKIVATIGPASRDPEMLLKLIDAGVDVFRLNFSHGTHEEHTATYRAIRAAAETRDRMIGVLQDLCGPKIRLGVIDQDQVDCSIDEQYFLSPVPDPTNPRVLHLPYVEVCEDLEPGDPVLFADGLVAMEVVSNQGGQAELKVTLPGRIRSRQGIHIPRTGRRIAAITPKDLEDLDWSRNHPVDYVGLSFVRSETDVTQLREELHRRGLQTRIVAKIEKREAVDRLEAILDVTDAIMVARGDLGVELDVARVPAIQKRIIMACRQARVPVITATQMLASMESSSRPTRAEVSDVYNAVIDGTDAVMLSGETAIGAYPVEAAATMSRILNQAEASFTHGRTDPGVLLRTGWLTDITSAMVDASSLVCQRLGAKLMVIATRSGRTALALSKHSSLTPTLALSDDPAVARAMSLFWGVMPVYCSAINDPARTLEMAVAWGLRRGLLAPGDRVVFQLGTLAGNPVHNAILVHTVEGTEGSLARDVEWRGGAAEAAGPA